MDEILGGLGIPAATIVENGSHANKTNDIAREASPNRIIRPNRLSNLEITETQTVTIAPKNGVGRF